MDFALNWADYAIIAVILISSMISIIRGFVREALSLIIWGAAAYLALTFSGSIGNAFKNEIHNPLIRLSIGFVVIFFGTLVIGAIVSAIVTMLVDKTGLSGTDRVLGILFGAIRGVLVISVLLLLAKFSSMPQNAWWQESTLIAKFEPIELWLQDFMHDQIKTYMPDKANLLKNGANATSSEIAIPSIASEAQKKDFKGIISEKKSDNVQ